MSKPYKKALILSGGGSRFGYYMGIYKALCEMDKKPDIVIATCGGSYISGLISLCSNPDTACQMMYSRSFYEMFCRFQPINPSQQTHRSKNILLISAFKRWWHFQKAKRKKHALKQKGNAHHLQSLPFSTINTLNQHALYQIDKESETNPFWQPQSLLKEVSLNRAGEKHHTFSNISEPIEQKPSTLIISARTQTFNDGFIWQQVLRPDNTTLTQHLQRLQVQGRLTAPISNYSPHILPDVHISDIEEMPIEIAVRASINDMFYFPPIRHQGNILLGGTIDLLPIELAFQLADDVYAERKLPFDRWTAEPAIHSVFGFFANMRRDDWHNFQVKKQQPNTNSTTSKTKDHKIHWIDTTDNRKKLSPVLVRRVKPFQGYIDLEYPSYEQFVRILKEQYEYGYQKTLTSV